MRLVFVSCKRPETRFIQDTEVPAKGGCKNGTNWSVHTASKQDQFCLRVLRELGRTNFGGNDKKPWPKFDLKIIDQLFKIQISTQNDLSQMGRHPKSSEAKKDFSFEMFPGLLGYLCPFHKKLCGFLCQLPSQIGRLHVWIFESLQERRKCSWNSSLGQGSHRTQSTSQQVHAYCGTHHGQWECSHRLQATPNGLHGNLHANLLTRPVWTGPEISHFCWLGPTKPRVLKFNRQSVNAANLLQHTPHPVLSAFVATETSAVEKYDRRFPGMSWILFLTYINLKCQIIAPDKHVFFERGFSEISCLRCINRSIPSACDVPALFMYKLHLWSWREECVLFSGHSDHSLNNWNG